jgi:integrase/recombinase XerC
VPSDAGRRRRASTFAAFWRTCTSGATPRASAARKLAAIRAFGRHLRREGRSRAIRRRSWARRGRIIRCPRTSARRRCRAARDAGHDAPLGRRDRAILELFYASGLRLSELVGLDVEDVNLSSRVVRVLGKGRKERLVPFNRSTEEAVRAWLGDWHALAAAREAPAPRSLRAGAPHGPHAAAAIRCS